ncbi:DUF1365 domain-containing protein [Idiomarina seosinensis]|uniref:DUF1365 domain-containing protein n=1 Tax=Idiomarina seosinensis TaxID=281739 RepID=A0A432ZIK1_9GAMM|nr:DUF1365 domain-containing protein [Idiomarina seosinensis]RUO77660.1 DUF1365 domain-containing protein [Idiomarina seosinensis]
MDSALYWGKVFHRRFRPRQHDFDYQFMQWFLALDELDQANKVSRWFSTKGFAPLWFRRKDYLKGETGDLQHAALTKMSALAAKPLSGRVFFLGNIRTFGIYFSPVNFYYLQQGGEFTHLLAEVSNTPWLERHYYLIDLSEQNPTSKKAFHVSPFNPLEMTYHWKLTDPGENLFIQLSAATEEKDFVAGMNLSRHSLNRSAVNRVLKTSPVMALKIIGGIYWQALKLFIKRTPFYGHP